MRTMTGSACHAVAAASTAAAGGRIRLCSVSHADATPGTSVAMNSIDVEHDRDADDDEVAERLDRRRDVVHPAESNGESRDRDCRVEIETGRVCQSDSLDERDEAEQCDRPPPVGRIAALSRAGAAA